MITYIIIALERIHRIGVIHGDLKCENIFLANKYKPKDYKNIKIKIGDFGLSEIGGDLRKILDSYEVPVEDKLYMITYITEYFFWFIPFTYAEYVIKIPGELVTHYPQDAYDYFWDGTDRTMRTITETHHYKNPMKGSRSIFRLSREDSTLFDYPEIQGQEQRVVLGNSRYPSRSVQILNSRLGKEYQIHVFVLLFYNAGPEIAERQKEYWEGGNKNELVVCLGMKNDSVQWCSPFSWCDSPVVESRIKSWFLDNPRLSIESFSAYLGPVIKKEWKRKEFKDFDYIRTELGGWDYIIILVLVLIYLGLISIWILNNEFENVD
jgi:hypothetical protein